MLTRVSGLCCFLKKHESKITMAKKILFLIILFCISNNGFTQQSKPLENAKVDPRVELLSIAFRLADAEEFKGEDFKNYVNDINTYFAPHWLFPSIHLPFCTQIRFRVMITDKLKKRFP